MISSIVLALFLSCICSFLALVRYRTALVEQGCVEGSLGDAEAWAAHVEASLGGDDPICTPIGGAYLTMVDAWLTPMVHTHTITMVDVRRRMRENAMRYAHTMPG